MKTSHEIAAAAAMFFATAAAQQFVMYTPGGDDTAVERADPIISPGKLSGHVHQIWGSGAFAPELSYQALQNTECTTVADARDRGNAQDNSVYWHPALYAEKSSGDGYLKIPTNGHKMYYKDAGSEKDTKREPFEFPQGFRMVAGNVFQRAAAEGQRQNITQWICHSSSGQNQGTDGGFPTGVQDCESVNGFNGAIHFPHCWNGQDYNGADPNAHIVYPEGDIQNGVCPSSHPTRLPHIFMENTFDIHKVVDQVKPNTFVLAMGDDTGYGWHADFFNGWEDGAIPELFRTCPQGNYGNEDIGSCPSFKPRSIKASECKLKTTYEESVVDPGNALPGCNPISNVNPAPRLVTAALGVVSTTCDLLSAVGDAVGDVTDGVGNLVGGLLGGGSNSGASSSSKTSSATVQQTTFATATKTSATATATASVITNQNAPSTGSNSLSCPDSNGQSFTSNSRTMTIECGTDHAGGDYDRVFKTTFQSCVEACAEADKCVAVSMRGTACYLKSELKAGITDSHVAGAKVAGSAEKRHVHMHGHMKRRDF